MTNNWLRRRWLNFRQGHSIYLIFILTFANFILIFHRLFIERVEVLNEIFSSVWLFAVFFVIMYIPIAILIGHWHRITQVKVETELVQRQNPMMAKWWRILVDMQTGKASKEEIEKFRALLKAIEEGKDRPEDLDNKKE